MGEYCTWIFAVGVAGIIAGRGAALEADLLVGRDVNGDSKIDLNTLPPSSREKE